MGEHSEHNLSFPMSGELYNSLDIVVRQGLGTESSLIWEILVKALFFT